MIKKISHIKLDKKKVIIISSIILLMTIGIILWLFVFNNKKETSLIVKGGEYANDTTLFALLQPIEPDEVTYNIYGDVGTYNSKDYKITINKKCQGDYKASWENDYSEPVIVEDVVTNHDLSNKPLKVGNHCELTINKQLDPTLSYDIEKMSWDKELYLNAYIELPDGTLINVSSVMSPIIQVNIYKNETRVVIRKGVAYFRIAKQNKNKIFTIQVADKLLFTSDGAEVFAYALAEDYGSISNTIRNEFLSMISSDTKYAKKIAKDRESGNNTINFNLIYNGTFKLTKGSGYLSERGFKEYEVIKDKEYIIQYLYNTGGDTIQEGNNLFIESAEYMSAGYYEDTRGVWGTKKAVYDFLDYQETLNSLNIGFEKIALNKKVKIGEVINKYDSYFKKQFTSKAAMKPELLKEFYNNTGWQYKACANLGSYYVSSANWCCPEGYQVNLVMGNCNFYNACTTGTHDVGNGKCCLNGYVMSSDGSKCVGISKATTGDLTNVAKINFSGIDSSKTYTCTDMSKLSSQVFCPKNGGTNLGAYISKEGKCCHLGS